MRCEFNHSNLSILVRTGHRQSGALHLRAVLRIQSEVAVVRFHRAARLTCKGRSAIRFERHFHGLAGQRATQRRDEQARRIRIRFGVSRIRQAHHVSRILDHQVLQTTTGTQKRNAFFSRETYAGECAIEASVGTAGTAEQPVVVGVVCRLIGGQPNRLDWY